MPISAQHCGVLKPLMRKPRMRVLLALLPLSCSPGLLVLPDCEPLISIIHTALSPALRSAMVFGLDPACV